MNMEHSEGTGLKDEGGRWTVWSIGGGQCFRKYAVITDISQKAKRG